MAYSVENHNLVSNYALIENSVVVNIIWLAVENESEFPGAVWLGDRPVDIGDTYDGEKFYRNNIEVLTPFEQSNLENSQYQEALNLLGIETEEQDES